MINSFGVLAEDEQTFTLNYLTDDEIKMELENPAIVSSGIGFHKIKAGDAIGWYLSGLIPISDTDIGILARGEIINDDYKTGSFWSWHMSVGAGYYINNEVIPYATLGKCFSNYSTCYFNMRHPTANDDDIDAMYYGLGTFIKEPYFNNYIDLSVSWSPYKGYDGSVLYIGYGHKF